MLSPASRASRSTFPIGYGCDDFLRKDDAFRSAVTLAIAVAVAEHHRLDALYLTCEAGDSIKPRAQALGLKTQTRSSPRQRATASRAFARFAGLTPY